MLSETTALQLLVTALALGAVVLILFERKRARAAITQLRRIHDLRRRATLRAPDEGGTSDHCPVIVEFDLS